MGSVFGETIADVILFLGEELLESVDDVIGTTSRYRVMVCHGLLDTHEHFR